MKKIIALMLSVVMVVLALASCGATATTGTTAGTNPTTGTTAGSTTVAGTNATAGTTAGTTATTGTDSTTSTTAGTTAPPVIVEPVDEDLLVWIDFAFDNLDEDGDTPFFIDVSGNGNHAYVGGYIDVTDGAAGTDDSAEIKEVGDYLTIKHNDAFNFTAEDEYTIDLWFKVDKSNLYTNHTWPCLFTKGSPNATSYFGCWINTSKNVDYVYYGTGTFDIENNKNVTGNKNAAAMKGTLNEEWHHFIAVQKNGVIYTYIDGKAGATETAKDISNNWDLYIGGKVGVAEDGTDKIQQFFGAIDEFKIYKRALSFEEITGIYPVEKDESKLVVDLDFSAITDGVIVDKTGRGNNATVSGGVTIVDGAVVFSGGAEDYLTIANSADVNFANTDNFIIEFKYRVDAKGGSWPCILSKGDKNNGWYGIWINNGIIWGGDTGNYTVAPLDIGTWHTIQIVRDSSKNAMYVFVDGSLSGQITTALGFESALDLFIGGKTYAGKGDAATTNVQPFFGAIDDFKIYDYGTDALTYVK